MPEPRALRSPDELIRIPPFHGWLGVRLEHVEEGRAVVRVPYRDELIGNPLIPAIHGGILSALVDLAGGVVLFAALGIPTPTIDMRVDYLKPALADRDLVADARSRQIGRTIAYVDVDVWQVPTGAAFPGNADARLVATGRCVYSTKDQGKPAPPGSVPIG